MKIAIPLGFVVSAVLCLAVVSASGEPFDPVFRVTEISGSCSVRAPGARRFDDAKEGHAYPYGTAVKTDRGSSATILFSEGNKCSVHENAALTIGEDRADKSAKFIVLDRGKLDITLKAGYSDHNTLRVETATATCAPLGSSFSVEAMSQDGLKVAIVLVSGGKVRVFGEDFSAVLDTKASLSVAGSSDGVFVRLRNIAGSIPVVVKDAQGNDKTVETEPEGIVKIWRRPGPEGTGVTILLADVSGQVEEVINYLAAAPEPAVEPDPVAAAADPDPDTEGVVEDLMEQHFSLSAFAQGAADDATDDSAKRDRDRFSRGGLPPPPPPPPKLGPPGKPGKPSLPDTPKRKKATTPPGKP